MKKKVLVLSLIAAVVAISVIGASLAWFADTDQATNVFTIGRIDIVQNEDFDPTTAQLLPVVGDDPTATTDNYIKKTVTVKNEGVNSAYVQTYVAVPAVLDTNGIVKLYDDGLAARGWEKIDGDANTAGVQPVATNVTITGETLPYNLYLYRHTAALAANAETQACLQYVYIDSAIDLNPYDTDSDGTVDTAYFVTAAGTEITTFNATGELHVYVATQGVQADGFATAEAALSAAFPHHPWAA